MMILLLLAFTLCESLAYSTIYSGSECSACLVDTTNYAGVCRPKSGTSVAYCCTQTEMNTTRTACGDSPLCSNDISAINMWPVTCPHEMYPCGAKSPEIGLNLGQSVTLRVNKFFDLGDSCYYHIFANDRIAVEDLDPYNLKHMQVYVTSLTAMTGYIGSVSTNATDLVATEITTYAYNFTVPYAYDFYLILGAETGSSKGDYDAIVQFSYYEYDPNCV